MFATGPVRLDMEFLLRRPKSHYRSGKHAAELKPDAPTWHFSKPDRDKLERAIMDALTGILFTDDAQVCDGPIAKRYAPCTGETGVLIVARQL